MFILQAEENQILNSAPEKLNFPVISDVPSPKTVLSDMIGHHSTPIGHGHLKFVMTGLLSGIAPAVTVIRMCPPMTTKNYHVYKPLLAIGQYEYFTTVYSSILSL